MGESSTASRSFGMGTFSIDLLPGERVKSYGEFEGEVTALLTNYRFCLLSVELRTLRAIPTVTIDSVNLCDPLKIRVSCKIGGVTNLRATSRMNAITWYDLLSEAIVRKDCMDLFAWTFAEKINSFPSSALVNQQFISEEELIYKEYNRLGYDAGYFKVSDENKSFLLCSSYPEYTIIPKEISYKDLADRTDNICSKRWPVVVWKCSATAAVLLRSSYPKPCVFGFRNSLDEKIFRLVHGYVDEYAPGKDVITFDARPSCLKFPMEAIGHSREHKQNTRYELLKLPDLDYMQKSYCKMRDHLSEDTIAKEDSRTTIWLEGVKDLLICAKTCLNALLNGHSTFVHCWEGWDRTPQIVSLVKIWGDGYYRTFEGFETLIRIEWIAYGHRFVERNGIYGKDVKAKLRNPLLSLDDPSALRDSLRVQKGENERAPVFLQFLDAVHQLLIFFPTAFEFNCHFLVEIARHVYSGLLAPFMFNSLREGREASKKKGIESVTVWNYIARDYDKMTNTLYNARTLYNLPAEDITSHLRFWKELYCNSLFDEGVEAEDLQGYSQSKKFGRIY